MTPASSAGSGRGDRAAAVDSRGRGKGITGPPGQAAAHAAAGDARVPGAGPARAPGAAPGLPPPRDCPGEGRR